LAVISLAARPATSLEPLLRVAVKLPFDSTIEVENTAELVLHVVVIAPAVPSYSARISSP
jgi:hypothetical protein